MSITLTGPGLTLALTSIILLVLSWVTVIGRLVVRRTIKGAGTDDWIMFAGLILYTFACQATITAAYNGVGTHAEHLNEYYERQGRKWFMFFQLFYVASTVPIKCSICVALLRITVAKKYIWALYAIMFLSCIAAFTTDIAVLAWCRPISATWDKRTGTCADPSIITNVSYFISTISIITDFSCAILPAFILSSVQLRFRIKASVAIILALGVVASTATLVRLRYLFSYNNPTEYLYNIAYIAIWSIVESGIGLIAGSLPALRPLLRYVPFFGGDSDAGSGDRTRSASRAKSALSGALAFSRSSRYKLDEPEYVAGAAYEGGGVGGGAGREGGRGQGGGRGARVSTTCEAAAANGERNWLDLSDSESQKYILKESHVSVANVAVMDFADFAARENGGARPYDAGRFDRSRFHE